MNQTQKTLQRALKEIHKLKSEISNLKKHKAEEVVPIIDSKNLVKSRVDEICSDREKALERLSIKLFGRVYAKQEQN